MLCYDTRVPRVLTLFCRFNSQLEGALSRWTSYQEDVSQFVLWMDRVEETLSCSDRQFSEMRDKTANLGKTKVLNSLSNNVPYKFRGVELLILFLFWMSIFGFVCFLASLWRSAESQQPSGNHCYKGVKYDRTLHHPAGGAAVTVQIQHP